MGLKHEFFEPMKVPGATHNALEPYRRRNGSPGIRKKGDLKRAEAKWEAHLARHDPPKPFEGPLAVRITFCYAPDRLHPAGSPKVTVPDVDNLAKTAIDAMKRLGWFAEDDAQVADLLLTKGYQDPPGVYVAVEEIGGGKGGR